MKLTDTQLVLLSAASRRQDSAVETKLKGGAADKVIGKLLNQHLVEEIPAQGGLPVWRRDDDIRGALLRSCSNHQARCPLPERLGGCRV